VVLFNTNPLPELVIIKLKATTEPLLIGLLFDMLLELDLIFKKFKKYRLVS
jgi:hypothetical protein